MKAFKQDTSNIHKLITLSAALNYQLRRAEETRKEISMLSLRARRVSKRATKQK